MNRFPLLVGTLTLAIALSSCGGDSNSEDLTLTAPEQPVAKVQGEPLETTPDDSTDVSATKKALEAGSYCYRTDTKVLQAIAEFLVEPNNSVTGTLEATVTDEANGYYTSYDQRFAGVLDSETLDAAITTNIEYDVQESQETWTLNKNQLSSGDSVFLKRVDCEEIIAIKANKKALNKPKTVATAPTPAPRTPSQSASTPPAAPKPKAIAQTQQKSPINVQFASGSIETVMRGAVGANQQQVYLLNATEGQNMRVNIITKSGKANFGVRVGNGEVIEEQLTDYIDFTLPFSGQYIITVNGESAGAEYALAIRIK
ncbi:MAG: hypothetical protein WBB82_16845 [Limnothrix sp.]